MEPRAARIQLVRCVMLYEMKNKNKRDLEKYWAEQAAKKAKAAKKKNGSQSDKNDASKSPASVPSSSE